jgi:hypothetical protein
MSVLSTENSSGPPQWADSYIGEYHSRDQKLFIQPLSPQKKKWLTIAKIEN